MAEDSNGVTESIDARDIPKHKRHPQIHDLYNNMSEGEILEVVASHDPKHLSQEFDERYAGGFMWEIKEEEPGKCRVWITKKEVSTAPF